MPQTLYRKYRPKTFSEMIGQNHIKITLQNEIETGKIAHAYLFFGPRGTGKTTAARLLAKAVNCLERKDGESEPCNRCESCLEINEGRSLDIIEIDAASHTGVDNVRENIIDNVVFSPAKRKYKVFIIDEVHMLSTSAFNALLKTLEEPPPHVIFILATTEIYKVPQTIISRCQRFDFKKVNLNDLVERLKLICGKEGIKVDLEILKNIARHAEGSIRDAESILGQIFSLADSSKIIKQSQAELVIPKSNFNLVAEFVDYLFDKKTEDSLRFVNSLVEEGRDLEQFLQDLIEFLRKILFAQIDNNLNRYSLELDEHLENKVLELSKKILPERLVTMIELLVAKKREMKFTEIAQLPLELAIVEICGIDKEEQSHEVVKIVGDQAKSAPSKTEENFLPRLNPDIRFKRETSPKIKIKTNLEQIKEKWQEILKQVGESNHSLLLILRVGQPMALEGNILQIGFRYRFHKERLNEPKNLAVIERVIKKIFNEEIKVSSVISDALPSIDQQEEINLKKILDEFGGRVVE